MGWWDTVKDGVSDAWDATGGKVIGSFDRSANNPYEAVDRQGYLDQQGRLDDYLTQVDGRVGPTIGANERAGQSSFRGGQHGLADMLMARARGEGLVSSQVLRQGADQGLAQQMAIASSARPQNAAMAQRLSAQNAGDITAGLAGQQALAGAQEANMAAMGLGGVLGQARGQDEGLGMFNASQQNALNQNQAEMNQRQTALDDAARGNLLGQGLGAYQGFEANMTNRYGAKLGVPTEGELLAGGAAGLIGAFIPG